MQDNRNLKQENQALREKVKDLEYMIELYQKKQEYSTDLNEQLKSRVEYLESFLENTPDKVKNLKVVRGGMFVDVTKIELLDGI